MNQNHIYFTAKNNPLTPRQQIMKTLHFTPTKTEDFKKIETAHGVYGSGEFFKIHCCAVIDEIPYTIIFDLTSVFNAPDHPDFKIISINHDSIPEIHSDLMNTKSLPEYIRDVIRQKVDELNSMFKDFVKGRV